MADVQERLTHLLALYSTHVQPHLPPSFPSPTTLARAALPWLGALSTTTAPLLALLTNTTSSSSPLAPASAGAMADLNLTSVVITLIALFISLKLLNALRRLVWSWLILLLRVGFWGAVLLGGIYVWGRGPDRVVGDMGV
ncbi:MAG: hypothetical protein M1832_000671, partial [Thelocarpon impressellum]